MQYRRSFTFTKLTVSALIGVGACGDDAAQDLSQNAHNLQNLIPECVADAAVPVAVTTNTINIWPPNHKFHTIGIADCVAVTESCDPDVRAAFVWASSDEPVDDKGDGHHEPDILIDDCGQVQVRAERQGPKDGRVYKLGVRAVDRDGNVAESTCTIVVDHDKRGVQGADSGEAYRLTFDGNDDRPVCDGTIPSTPEGEPQRDGGAGSGEGEDDETDTTSPDGGDATPPGEQPDAGSGEIVI